MKIGSPGVRRKEYKEFYGRVHKKPTDWFTLGMAFIISFVITGFVIYEIIGIVKDFIT